MTRPKKFSGASVEERTLYVGKTLLQRSMRRMSKYPREPRTFSRFWLFFPIGLVGSFFGAYGCLVYLQKYLSGEGKFLDVVALSIPVIIMSGLFLHGLFYRAGVDEEKIWTRFGWLYYREVKFSELTAIRIGDRNLRLYAGRMRVRMFYHYYDYILANIRILEEMQKRRFELPDNVMPGDANWDEEAQIWRNIFAKDAFDDHYKYFLSHPKELAYLNSLTEPPTVYES